FIIGLLGAFRPKDVRKRDPKQIFAWLVCDPMLVSVTNLVARGTLMFTGDWVEVEVDLAAVDFVFLLKNGNFLHIDERFGHAEWFKTVNGHIEAHEFYQKQGEGFDTLRTVVMLTATNHNRVFIRYFRA